MPRKPLLLTTLLGYVASNVVVAVAPTIEILAVGRVLGGTSHALFFSLCIGYVPRLVGRADLGRGLALAAGGATAGYVLGVPLSTSLGTAVGWRESFWVLACAAAVTAALVAIFLPAVVGPSDPETRGGRHGNLVAVVASNSLAFLGHYTLYTYISVLLLTVGIAEGAVGPLLLVCGGCGLIGLWLTGRTLDTRPRRTALLVLTVVVVTLLAVAVASPWSVPLVAAVALWSASFGGVPSLYQSAAVRTHSTSPEMAGAWINATSNVGIAGGAGLGGVLLPLTGVTGLAWVSAAFVITALIVAYISRGAFRDS
jgi:predicted MFS family arabinose efflux permease